MPSNFAFVPCKDRMIRLRHYVHRQHEICQQLLDNHQYSNETELICPPVFDQIYCWLPTPSGNYSRKSCPFSGQNDITMSRRCSSDSFWDVTDVEKNESYRVARWDRPDYGNCPHGFDESNNPIVGRSNDVGYLVALMLQNYFQSEYLEWLHEAFNTVDYVGNGFSIVCLIFALLIFMKFSQLQDNRVKIHINLFVAMLSQAATAVIHYSFYGCKIFFTMLINSMAYNYEDSQICRALMTLSHYFKLSIFTWLMIEGWYFYNYISRAPYCENVKLKSHLIVGWGLPVIVLIPWLVVHNFYSSSSNFCWVDVDERINLIAIPIFLIVLINVSFFILNARIIFIKMKQTYMSSRRMQYWRWIKSSLMLMPLFGTYDILYSIWPWVHSQYFKISLLLIVRLMAAFQGCTVSILYCFTNGHVKREVKRAWRNWKLQRNIETEIHKRKGSSDTTIEACHSTNKDNNCKAKFTLSTSYI